MPFIQIKNDIIHTIKMEFNLNLHCNFRCAECSRNSPYVGPEFASLSLFKKDVAALERVVRVKRFRFEGGEPLMNKKILMFIEVMRNSNLAEKIHVHTNGDLLHLADEALFREIDILSISRYPGTGRNEFKINRAKELCDRHQTELRIETIRGFRRINVDNATEFHLTQKIFDSCQIAHSWYCQTFFNGFFYLCSRPLCISKYRQKKGLNILNYAMLDGIHIHSPNLFERLRDYLGKHEPLVSCSHCLGSIGLNEPWRRLSVKECQFPVTIQEPAESLIDYRRLAYLLRWEYLQRKILYYLPFLPIARFLQMLRDATYYRSRRTA